MVKPTNAQTIPKPSVPEFTLRYVVQPYYIPASTPTYTIDPYTGEQKIQTSGSPSQSGNNRTIEITIKNQLFSSYYDSKHNYVYLSFNVSYKGHFEDTWKYYSNYGAGWSKSNSEYVTIIFTEPPSEGQIDFRIKAQIGYYYEYYMPWEAYGFVGQSGDWSNIQTITITEGSTSASTSPSPNPTPTPTVPELSWLVIVPLMLSVFSVAIVARQRKNS